MTLCGSPRRGLSKIPATGKRVSFHGIDMMRYKGGKVAEVWHYGDDAAVMSQLGVKLPAA